MSDQQADLFRAVESDAIPPDTIIMGDFSEFARAARENRQVNPKAFAVLRVTPPDDTPAARLDSGQIV